MKYVNRHIKEMNHGHFYDRTLSTDWKETQENDEKEESYSERRGSNLE
jgi:hypothetical protein